MEYIQSCGDELIFNARVIRLVEYVASLRRLRLVEIAEPVIEVFETRSSWASSSSAKTKSPTVRAASTAAIRRRNCCIVKRAEESDGIRAGHRPLVGLSFRVTFLILSS